MAVTVVPYNPWREQLAMSFLGPLIGNMIQRQQQRDDNRKMNALLGELAGEGDAGIYPGFEAPRTVAGGDPWQNTWNEMSGTLPQFDNAVRASQTDGAGGVGRLMQLMASKRFGGVDPKLALTLAQPYLAERQAARAAAAEAAAQAQRQAELSQFTGGLAGLDPRAYMRELNRAVMMGLVDPKVLDHMGTWEAKALHSPQSVDLGDARKIISFDPATGTAREVFSGNVGMTPYQGEQAALGWAGQSETERYHRANEGLRAQEIEETRTNNAERRKLDREKHEHEKGKGKYELKQDAAGNYVRVDINTGEVTDVVRPDGKPVQGPTKAESTAGEVTNRDIWKANLEGVDRKIEALEKEKETLNDPLNAMSDDPDRNRAREERLRNIDETLNRLRAQRDALTAPLTKKSATPPQATVPGRAAPVQTTAPASMDVAPQAAEQQTALNVLNGAVSGDIGGNGPQYNARPDARKSTQARAQNKPRTISSEDYNAMLRATLRNELPGVRNKAELDEYLRQRGVAIIPKIARTGGV